MEKPCLLLQQGRTLNSTESLPKSILVFLNLVSPKISTSPGLVAKITQLSKYSQILQQLVRMLRDPKPYKRLFRPSHANQMVATREAKNICLQLNFFYIMLLISCVQKLQLKLH